jgi:hypothetical protein
MKNYKHLPVLAALIIGGSMNLSAGLIGNGDFGSGDLTSWTLFTTPGGVHNSSGSGVSSFDTTGAGASNAAEFNVGNAVSAGNENGGGIRQSFNLAADNTVDFGLDFASTTAISNGSGGTFSIVVDGNSLISFDVGSVNAGSTDRGSLAASANLIAGNHSLAILITRPYTTATDTPHEFIDNVTAVESGNAAPEPGTLVLFGTAMVTVALARRKKA